MDALPRQQVLWVIIVILFVLCVLFTCIEQSTIIINDAKLKRLAESGNKKAKKLLSFLDGKSAAFRSAIQFINTLLMLSLGACTMFMYINPLTEFFIGIGAAKLFAFIIALILTVLITTFVYLIVGVFVPKGLAGKYSTQIAISLVDIAVLITHVSLPFVYIPEILSKLLLRILGVKPGEHEEDVTEEEIRMLVDIGSESGVIDDDEKEMIHNIFELDDKPVEDIMTHRTEAVILWMDDSLEKWEQIINETNHTRYPVCDDAVDNVIGVINSRDFYRFLLQDRGGDVRKIMREPYFVPKTIKADEMFSQMQDKNAHFAIVVDEYGGFRGILTQEDLIEEIVGELYSEYEVPEEDHDIVKLSDDTWFIFGSAEIDDVCDELGIEIPDDEYNTFAGLILDELGTVPADGETPELTIGRMKINVTKISEHRIEETRVVLIPEAGSDDKENYDKNEKNQDGEN